MLSMFAPRYLGRARLAQENPLLQQTVSQTQALQQQAGQAQANTGDQAAAAQLQNMLNQQTATLHQVEQTVTEQGASKLWIPVAIGVGVLGLVSYFLTRK